MPRYPIPSGATELILEEPKFYVPPVAENLPPEVNAGNDVTITLPVNSVQLIGNAKDPDGSILSVLWLQESGQPATIVNPNFQSTTITGLKEGINTFRFEASDDKGVKKTDTVIVNVKPIQVEPPAQGIYGFGSRATGGKGYIELAVNASNFESSIGNNRILRFSGPAIIKKNFTIGYSNLTIDGNGYDVLFDGTGTKNWEDGLSIRGKNIIIKGIASINWHNDCINVVGGQDIAIIRCFAQGAGDGNIDLASGSFITVQETMTAGKSKNGNQLVTANYVSLHNNCYIGDERNPLAHGSYSTVFMDMRNCFCYNWQGFAISCYLNARGNVVNNFLQSTSNPQNAIDNLDGWNNNATKGKLYAAGNVSGNSGVNPNADSNSSEHDVPDWAKLPMIGAREAAQKILGLTFANPIANSLLKSISLK